MSVCALVRSVLVSGVAVACLGASVSVAQAAPLNGGGAESSVASNVGSVSVVSLKDSDSGDVREVDGFSTPVIYKDGWSDHGRGKCGGINSCPTDPVKYEKYMKCLRTRFQLGVSVAALIASAFEPGGLAVVSSTLSAYGIKLSAEDVYNTCFK